MSKAWPLVKLGEVLDKSQAWIELDPQQEYKEVTVRLWGKGVTLRGIVIGSQITGSRRLQVHSNQFILSRIDARNGAFGLIPDELDNAVVSNDFPVFDIHQKRLLPKYLHWLSKTRNFVESCKSVSEGTTNRVRLKEDKFIQIEIPLPPLTEQQRIVAKIERLVGKIEEARTLYHAASYEIDALLSSQLKNLINKNRNWEWKKISEVAEINPKRTKTNLNVTDKVSFIPMSAIDAESGEIKSAQVKPIIEVMKGYTFFIEGDVLFARITPCMQNGKSTIAKNLTNGVGFGTTEFHVIRPKSGIINTWLHRIIRSSDFIRDAEANFKGTAGQQRVPADFLMEKSIPLPKLEEQKRLVDYLNNINNKTDYIKAIQSQTAAELDALLPSILDKAFKGEL